MEQLPDLLETNIRQRGDVGGSAKKVGLRIKELDRIYENSRGGDRKSNLNNYGLNHAQMAKIMGISVSTLENYKKLTEMIPELEELVDTGIKRKATGGRSVQVAFWLWLIAKKEIYIIIGFCCIIFNQFI